MTDRLVPLDVWARLKYGEHMPTVGTLRRWVREAKILPVPKKHGRSYYVSESARYVDTSDPHYPKAYRESQAAQ